MQERMRGAGRHQVEDISFGFVLPVEEEEFLEEPPLPIPAPPKSTTPTPPTDVLRRPTPNTSAKRTHLPSENAPQTVSPPTPPPPATETPPGVVAPISPSEVEDSPDPGTTETPLIQDTQSSTQRQPSRLRRVSYAEEVEVRETNLSGGLSKKRTSVPLSSPAAAPSAAALSEEVGESPANAPGSGRRRPLRSGATPVIGSSTILQRVLEELDDTTAGPPSSSPVERLKANRRNSDSLRSGASRVSSRAVEARRRSPRLSEGSVAASDSVDEPSSLVILGHGDDSVDGHGDSNLEIETVPDEDDQDVAEEITENEAARRLGRKRPRRSLPAPSPELDSGLVDQTQPEAEPEPVVKRRRTKKVAESPAAQQQPKTRGPRSKTKPQSKEKVLPKKQTTKRKSSSKQRGGDEEREGEAGAGSIAVTVQRFTKNNATIQWGSDEEDDDGVGDGILTGEIPFTSRAGVNVIDVLSILSEELINSFLSRLQQKAQEADDAATKREQKTMASALEAFQEELRTRLLEHVRLFCSCFPKTETTDTDTPCPTFRQ